MPPAEIGEIPSAEALTRVDLQMARIAVVLFNLGGPDRPESVRPFLFNLFDDRAIIDLPGFLRTPLAALIAWRRARITRDIYAGIGGRSPLLELTRAQADALQGRLAGTGETRVFIAMRYWHPMSIEAAHAVADFGPDKVVLVPLYPQYSTTTTGSSLAAWHAAAKAVELNAPTSAVCCYPVQAGLVSAQVELVRRAIERASARPPIRVLFSAHGLPERVVRGGDPYQRQVEETSRAVVAGLGIEGLDWVICYQSRVGPLKWIGPATVDEIARAGRAGIGLVIVPIAFVSEHSETLVELDVEYRRHADELGVRVFERVPALGVARDFIGGLADLVRAAVEAPAGVACEAGRRPCAGEFRGCPMVRAQAMVD